MKRPAPIKPPKITTETTVRLDLDEVVTAVRQWVASRYGDKVGYVTDDARVDFEIADFEDESAVLTGATLTVTREEKDGPA